ncbi:unnamed protein product, partial [Heterotrigona itama]
MATNVLTSSLSKESTDSDENGKEIKIKTFNRKEEIDFNLCPF